MIQDRWLHHCLCLLWLCLRHHLLLRCDRSLNHLRRLHRFLGNEWLKPSAHRGSEVPSRHCCRLLLFMFLHKLLRKLLRHLLLNLIRHLIQHLLVRLLPAILGVALLLFLLLVLRIHVQARLHCLLRKAESHVDVGEGLLFHVFLGASLVVAIYMHSDLVVVVFIHIARGTGCVGRRGDEVARHIENRLRLIFALLWALKIIFLFLFHTIFLLSIRVDEAVIEDDHLLLLEDGISQKIGDDAARTVFEVIPSILRLLRRRLKLH
mmetsp:Transcript_60773/g.130576  ORF Transcript_60773/g.130576 Transcript_60773/m.130576 type:complete len:264 (+) Transcript_60773:952-1743(+)